MMVSQKVEKTSSCWMGEGWSEGEYNVISGPYVPLLLPPSCLPPQVGEDKRRKSIVALPPGEGNPIFYECITYKFYIK
jgi:hypothetical protein